MEMASSNRTNPKGFQKPPRYAEKISFMMKKVIVAAIVVCAAHGFSYSEETITLPHSKVVVRLQKDANGGRTYQISRDGINFGPVQRQRQTIHLKAGAFNPVDALGNSVGDTHPLHPALRSDKNGKTYIIQFVTTTLPEYREQLTALGVKLCGYIPDQSFMAKMDPSLLDRVRALSFVRWVGNYHHSYKLDEALQKTVKDVADNMVVPETIDRYIIMLVARDPETKISVADLIKGMRGSIIQNESNSFRIDAFLNPQQLAKLIKSDDIAHIEAWTPIGYDMDIARQISGANYVANVPGGYTGAGVRGEVMDAGLLVTHQDFQNHPPIIHGGNHPWDFSHGTECYGILFGDGTSDATARGLLPDGQGIFSYSGNPVTHPVDDRTLHIQQLVDPAGAYRAVFQSYSSGHSITKNYTDVSITLDQILFDNDILITQSQSNWGDQDSRPEAWCKNLVSVGGIAHQNTLTKNDDQWGTAPAGCGLALQFASSTGPASDGRIKPDLCHFYDATWTTGPTSNTAHCDFSGTSGATPIVAGHFGLTFQMWADGVFLGNRGANRDVFDSRPHASTAKAIMINTAAQYDFNGTAANLTRVHQGWGMPDVHQLYTTAENNGWHIPILVNEDRILRQWDAANYFLRVNAPGNWLRATLVYSDPPPAAGATSALVNVLFIRVISPNGTEYYGNVGLDAGNWSTSGGAPNTIDNVQNVFVQNADAGEWTIQVRADAINQDGHVETAALDADFALVVTTGGVNNSRWTNSGIRFSCNNREWMRINENCDLLFAGNHRSMPVSGLQFTYGGLAKATLENTNGHFSSASVPNPDVPTTVNPLPSTGITFTNKYSGNGFQIGNDGLLRSNVDAFVVAHSF
jgi:serine protease AprX